MRNVTAQLNNKLLVNHEYTCTCVSEFILKCYYFVIAYSCDYISDKISTCIPENLQYVSLKLD